MRAGDIKKMLNPDRIAVIGASEIIGSVGRATIENLLKSKGRKIFPVNPNRKSVLNLPSFPDILSVPEKVDLAVVATPAMTVPEVVEQCGKAGVEGVVIVSAGFREVGKEGLELEERLIGMKVKYGTRIIGPNCLGFMMPHRSLNATLLRVCPQPGNIAFITQSGAFGRALLNWGINAQIGFSFLASLGSMVDVDFGDLIDFLGNDPYTKSIMIYMEESIGDIKKFASAAKCFSRNKPIVVLRPAHLPKQTKTALTHTGMMADINHIYNAAFKRFGIVAVKEVRDLFHASTILYSKKLPKGPRLAIITNAIGVGIMAANTLIEAGGELSGLSDETVKKLDAVLPAYWNGANPIDVLKDADIERYMKVLNICLNDFHVNGILIIFTPQAAAGSEELAHTITETAGRTAKPIITTWMGGKDVQAGRQLFMRKNIPTFETPEEAARAYVYMYNYERNLETLYETPAELPVDQTPPKYNLKALTRKALKEETTILTEEGSGRFLAMYNIPIVKTYIAKDVEEALRAANIIGYPVVTKIISPDIAFRHDVGGVCIGVNSDDELRGEYTKLMHRMQGIVPQVTLRGVIVQKMIEKIDYEVILGAKKDKEFGSVILFGMGGVNTEIYRDFSIGLPPLNQVMARRMMEDTEIYKMLQGYRGKPPADFRKLEQIIVNFSNLIMDFPEIAEMDINPLLISDGNAYAADARIILDKGYTEHASQYPHLVFSPYPTRYIMHWNLPDGTDVLLRPIRPEDEPLQHEMLSTLSEETLKNRFFQVIRDITHEMHTRMCNIDYDREIAIVAEIREGVKRRIIGICRIIIEPGFEKGEFAVVVHDQYQDKGLGRKLVDIIIGIAHDKKLEEFYGIVQSRNFKMLSVCKKLGFSVEPLPDMLSRVSIVLK